MAEEVETRDKRQETRDKRQESAALAKNVRLKPFFFVHVPLKREVIHKNISGGSAQNKAEGFKRDKA